MGLPLGRVVATPEALKLLQESGEDPLYYLARHRSGDWGRLMLTTAGRTNSPYSTAGASSVPIR